MAIRAAWFKSLLTPAVFHGSWPPALKLTVTRTWAAVSWAVTSRAVTLKVPKCIFASAGYHFSSSRRIALVSASTGPEPSALVIATVESPMDSSIEA